MLFSEYLGIKKVAKIVLGLERPAEVIIVGGVETFFRQKTQSFHYLCYRLKKRVKRVLMRP